MEGTSNYVIWKARISCLLDEHDLKTYVDSVKVVPADPDLLKKYKDEMAKARRVILRRVRDHVVCHIISKDIAWQMWEALAMLYEGSSEQRKMYLEQKMRSTKMQKGERIDPFLKKLQEIRDSLAVVGSTPQPTEMVKLALNSVLEEWQVFVQSILGRARLPKWEGI